MPFSWLVIDPQSLHSRLCHFSVGAFHKAYNCPQPLQEHVTDEMTRDAAFELVDEAIELVIQRLGHAQGSTT